MEVPPTGKILIAEPFMEDPYFKGAVVLLCESRHQGSFGLILNRPSNSKVHEVVEGFPEGEHLIYYGGPVQTNTLHYVHRLGKLIPDSVEVADGIFWGGDFEKLMFLIETRQVHPNEVRFFFGYAGWDAGQLAGEIEINSWFITGIRAEVLFDESPKNLWRAVLQSMGDRFMVIANLPEHPHLN